MNSVTKYIYYIAKSQTLVVVTEVLHNAYETSLLTVRLERFAGEISLVSTSAASKDFFEKRAYQGDFQVMHVFPY